MCLNLIGGPSWVGVDPTEFEGEIVNAEVLAARLDFSESFRHHLRRNKSILCMFFGQFEKLADVVVEEKGASIPQMATILLVYHTLARGVCCFAAYKSSKKKLYFKYGLQMKATMSGWIKNGNPNFHHYLSLLDAWHQAVAGNKYEATRHFESAILLAFSCRIPRDRNFCRNDRLCAIWCV